MISAHDEADFDAFVITESPRLLRTAFLLVTDRGHAEDLLQTALFRTARRWRAARDNPVRYARRVLVNLAIDRSRDRRRRPPEVELTVEPPAEPAVDQVLERDALLRAAAALPVGQRAVLVLRFFDDLSVEETAAALGCSTGTVKSQTHRALSSLRGRLDEHTPTPRRPR